MNWIAAVWHCFHKDWFIEKNTKLRLQSMLFFGLLTLLLFSFGVGPHQTMLRQLSSGFLWLAILLASTLGLTESLRLEHANEALLHTRLIPVSPSALFMGKALMNTLLLTLLGLCMLPIASALYDVSMLRHLPIMLLILLLGAGAMSALGTLYAYIAFQSKSRDVLLPFLLFPVLVPSLLAAVKATHLIVEGDIMQQLPSWLALLVFFNLLYWPICAILFERVIES